VAQPVEDVDSCILARHGVRPMFSDGGRAMTDTVPTPTDYRPCAGMMLVNRLGKVFVARRLDGSVDSWQMPQGGIDEGETPEVAALRELAEETGIVAAKVAIIGRSVEEHVYDLPDGLIGRLWDGRFRGQRQSWFCLRFLGQDGDIDIATEHPEFAEWRWADPDELPDLAVPFKRALYRAVLAEFRELL